MQIEEESLDRIRDAVRPKIIKQVRAFLGLVGYYMKFTQLTPSSSIDRLD